MLTPVNIGTASYGAATRTLTWPEFTLPPGESISFTFTALLTDDQELVNSLGGFITNQVMLTSTVDTSTSNTASFFATMVYQTFLPLMVQTSSSVPSTAAVDAADSPQVHLTRKPGR